MKTKKTLRTEWLQWRSSLDETSKNSSDALIREQCMSFLKQREEKRIALYHPFRNEINLLPLMTMLPNKLFLFPKVNDDGMNFYQAKTISDFKKGRFGIMEPSHDKRLSPEVLIVPALAIDKQGFRLGYGGGFYDRYISQNPECFLITAIYKNQWIQELPRDPWDRPVQAIITEEETRCL